MKNSPDKVMKLKVRQIFAANKGVNEFFFTSDVYAWKSQEAAAKHAANLEAKAVTKITRKMAESGDFSIDTSVTVEKESQPKTK